MEATPVGHGWTENDARSIPKGMEVLNPRNITPEKMVQHTTLALREIFQEAKLSDKNIYIDFPGGHLIASPLDYRIHIIRINPKNTPGIQEYPPTQESISINYPTSKQVLEGKNPYVQYICKHQHDGYGPEPRRNGTDVYNFNSPIDWQCMLFDGNTARTFANRSITPELLEKMQRFLEDIKQILSQHHTPESVIGDTKIAVCRNLEASNAA